MNPENNVEFDADRMDERRHKKLLYSRLEPSSVEPKIIQFLIRKHIIKNERQGDIILIALFFLCIAVSIFIYTHTSSGGAAAQVTQQSVLNAITR